MEHCSHAPAQRAEAPPAASTSLPLLLLLPPSSFIVMVDMVVMLMLMTIMIAVMVVVAVDSMKKNNSAVPRKGSSPDGAETDGDRDDPRSVGLGAKPRARSGRSRMRPE